MLPKYTQMTTASPEAIWHFWSDVSTWPQWDTQIAQAQLHGSFAEGATGEMVTQTGNHLKFKIQDVSSSGYTFLIIVPLGAVSIKRYLEPQAFTHAVSFVGLSAPITSRVLGGWFENILPDVLQKLAALAEAYDATKL